MRKLRIKSYLVKRALFALLLLVCLLYLCNFACIALHKMPPEDRVDCNSPFHPPLRFDATLPLRVPQRSHQIQGKIPLIVHFVFGLKNSGEQFTLVQYLSIVSALNVLKPQRAILHHGERPRGFYWDMIKEHVELNPARDVQDIFGNAVHHYAHKADIIRLEALLKYGGIYLDLDVWVLRPFDHLLSHDFVMGQEGENGRIGLCNAIILASKDSEFLKRWYQLYMSFDSTKWNYHSVQLPKRLAKQHPDEILVLGHDQFFWPLWDQAGLMEMYAGHTYTYASNLAVHTWNSAAQNHTSTLSQSALLECRSSLLSMMRDYVATPLVSVIVPCYKQRQFIGDAIKSVIDQSWPHWELIVVDDGSPDKCGDHVAALARSYPKAPQLQTELTIIKQENQGLARSRNIGISKARGAWICVLDADDKIGPEYFRDAEFAMSRDPRVGVIYSDQQFFGESNWYWTVPGLDFQTALMSGPLPVMSLFRRSLWKEVGGYSSSLPWGNEDWDFWLKLVGYGARSVKLQGVHTYYRYKAKSMMRDSAPEREIEHAMLKTRYPGLYNTALLLIAQNYVAQMSNATLARLEARSAKMPDKTSDLACNCFWRALRAFRDKDLRKAEHLALQASRLDDGSLSWQPRFLLEKNIVQPRRAYASQRDFADVGDVCFIAKKPQLSRAFERV